MSHEPFQGVRNTLDQFAKMGIFKAGMNLSTINSVNGALADGVRCTDATLTAIEGAARRTEQHPNERIAKRSKALLEIIAQRRTQNAAAAPNGGRRQ